jgi:hypothetical protein
VSGAGQATPAARSGDRFFHQKAAVGAGKLKACRWLFYGIKINGFDCGDR